MSPRLRRSPPKARAPRANAEWLSTAEAAYYLGVSTHTLYKWRWLGEGPSAARVGRVIRYRRPALDAWLLGRPQRGAATTAARRAASPVSGG